MQLLLFQVVYTRNAVLSMILCSLPCDWHDQRVFYQHLVTELSDMASVLLCQTNRELNQQICCSSVQQPKPQKVHSHDSPNIPRFSATCCDNDVES